MYLIHVPSQLQVRLGSNSSLSENLTQELQQSLDSFVDVFAEPTLLPPSRTFDRAMLVMIDTPIGCKPYCYGPLQTQQMLNSGIVRESSSSFVAPLVSV